MCPFKDQSRSWVVTIVCFFTLFSVGLIKSDFDNYVQCGGDHWEYQSIAVNTVSGKGFMMAGGILPYESYHFRKYNTEPWAIDKKDFERAASRSFYRSPVYPFFLACVYSIVGIQPVVVKYVQLALMCLGAGLLIPVGFLVAGRIGVICGLVSSLLFVGSFHEICGKIYAEPLLTFIASLVLLIWVLYLKRPSRKKAALLGFIIGIAILSKGIFYFLTLFLILILGNSLITSFSARLLKQTATLLIAVVLTVLPYLIWQNFTVETSSELIFISQDGEVALLGGNNEFATDGNWIHTTNMVSGFYSSLPLEIHPLKKLFAYYWQYPEKVVPSLFRKLRNSILRPPAAALLTHAAILYILFAMFRSITTRSVFVILSLCIFVFNLFSGNYLHYRFIERSPYYYIPIITVITVGIILFFRRQKSSLLFRTIIPFLFSLVFITVLFYGHERIVMPFYLALMLLATLMLANLFSGIWFFEPLSRTVAFMKTKDLKTRLYYLVMLLLPVIIPYSIVEIYLRSNGGLDTYAEKTGNSYRSYYNQEPASIYWSHPVNTTYTVNQGDFSYEYETNEIGLREKRNAISNPDTSTFRILTLGDSFTEGMGAPPDSAWPRVLEFPEIIANLTEGKRVAVYNAGMAGSDPFFNYVMLRDKLIDFKPNLVIQCINTSDLTDYLFRGGLERFKENKALFRKGPWWEIIYRFSYTFRFVVHAVFNYDFLLVDNKTRTELFNQSIREYASLFATQMAEMASRKNFSVVYIIQPMPSDIGFVGDEYKLLKTLDSTLRAHELQSFDLLPAMQDAIGNDTTFRYSWPVDGHYTADGYWIMGNIIADSLAEEVLVVPYSASPILSADLSSL